MGHVAGQTSRRQKRTKSVWRQRVEAFQLLGHQVWRQVAGNAMQEPSVSRYTLLAAMVPEALSGPTSRRAAPFGASPVRPTRHGDLKLASCWPQASQLIHFTTRSLQDLNVCPMHVRIHGCCLNIVAQVHAPFTRGQLVAAEAETFVTLVRRDRSTSTLVPAGCCHYFESRSSQSSGPTLDKTPNPQPYTLKNPCQNRVAGTL